MRSNKMTDNACFNGEEAFQSGTDTIPQVKDIIIPLVLFSKSTLVLSPITQRFGENGFSMVEVRYTGDAKSNY